MQSQRAQRLCSKQSHQRHDVPRRLANERTVALVYHHLHIQNHNLLVSPYTGIHPTRRCRRLAHAAVADTEDHRAHLEWIDIDLLLVVGVYFDRLLYREGNPW
jgi:hypothetical protein